MEITEISKETIFGPSKVKTIIIEPYYDLHGMIIPEDKKTLCSKYVEVVEHKYIHSLFGDMDDYEVYIDGQRYSDIEVTSLQGNSTQLIIKGCSGAG